MIDEDETVKDMSDVASDATVDETMFNPSMHTGIRALANLLLLEHDFRRAEQDTELAQLAVDRLNCFAHYTCAVFWTVRYGRFVKKTVVSNDCAAFDDNEKTNKKAQNKAMSQWSKSLARWLAQELRINKAPMLINAEMMDDKLLHLWPETLPTSALAVPVKSPQGRILGGIVLLREEVWKPSFQTLMEQMAETLGYSLRALELGMYDKKFDGKGKWIAFFGALLLVGSLLVSILFKAPVLDKADMSIEADISRNLPQPEQKDNVADSVKTPLPFRWLRGLVMHPEDATSLKK